ncbi:unnamed protein product [Didymodactylos carnosus]|nr:unnamed protein product [Didymodactylos carnosus]CAF4029225.1 unnamed protein product [Didymodactylos carnosus]
MDSLRQTLESAANIFLSSSQTTVTQDQRRDAEKIFLQFRRSNFSFDLYSYLIEHSQSHYVIYQTLTALREGIVKEWLVLSDETKEQVVQYLLQYVYGQYQTLSIHVREQALQILVVINKRRKASKQPQTEYTVTNALYNLIQSPDNEQYQFGLMLLSTFLNEYSCSNGNEAGLTLDQRYSVKKDFESNELKNIFELLLNKLQLFLQNDENCLKLLELTLNSIEKILLWNFSLPATTTRHRHHLITFTHAETSDFRPPQTWKQLVYDQRLIEFFFHVYKTIKQQQHLRIANVKLCYSLRSQILRSLSQLACLNGPLMSDEQCRLQYLTTFCAHFVETFPPSTSTFDNLSECFDLASIISNLITLFSVKGFCSMSNDLCHEFLRLMAHITIVLCRCTTSHQQVNYDPAISKEAFDRILQAWARLLSGIDFGRFENLRTLAIEIFDSYLNSHLHSSSNNIVNEHEQDEDENNEDDDRELFSEQLISIGLFGRHIIDHALPLLTRLLLDRTQKLCTTMEMLTTTSTTVNVRDLDKINDDLHWLLLICGHVLTEEYLDSDSECATIPEAIMNFSYSQVKYCNLEKCCQISQLVLSKSIDLSTEAMQDVNPVTQCVVTVLKLSEIERYLSRIGLFDHVSVQVAISLTWFIKRLAANYLGFNADNYKQVSQALSLTLGKGSEVLEFLTKEFLSKVVSNLHMWTSEINVIKETADLFVTLSLRKDSSNILIRSDLFWSLCDQVVSNVMPLQLISEEIKRQLLKGITTACLNSSNDEDKVRFDRSILTVLQQRLNSITTTIKTLLEQMNYEFKVKQNQHVQQTVLPDDSKSVLLSHCCSALESFFSETMLSQVSSLLNSYCGLIEGGSRSSQSSYLFERSLSTLEDVCELFDFYHSYSDIIQIVLDLFNVYSENILVYLNLTHSKIFYSFMLKIIQLFSKCNHGKKSSEVNSDEDYNQHIYTLLTCLNHLLAKDFIDFSNDKSTVVYQDGESSTS